MSMKTIDINGEKYILKVDVDKELEKIKQKESKFSVIKPYGLADLAHVMAMGTVQLDSNSKATRISYDYLNHAIKIIKEMGCDEVVIAIISEEEPIIIGREIDENNRLSGLIIAPIVKEEE